VRTLLSRKVSFERRRPTGASLPEEWHVAFGVGANPCVRPRLEGSRSGLPLR
jgi:hypothetical protein